VLAGLVKRKRSSDGPHRKEETRRRSGSVVEIGPKRVLGNSKSFSCSRFHTKLNSYSNLSIFYSKTKTKQTTNQNKMQPV
jgi:hypothetical protein